MLASATFEKKIYQYENRRTSVLKEKTTRVEALTDVRELNIKLARVKFEH